MRVETTSRVLKCKYSQHVRTLDHTLAYTLASTDLITHCLFIFLSLVTITVLPALFYHETCNQPIEGARLFSKQAGLLIHCLYELFCMF